MTLGLLILALAFVGIAASLAGAVLLVKRECEASRAGWAGQSVAIPRSRHKETDHSAREI